MPLSVPPSASPVRESTHASAVAHVMVNQAAHVVAARIVSESSTGVAVVLVQLSAGNCEGGPHRAGAHLHRDSREGF